jgi:hypothetical protein
VLFKPITVMKIRQDYDDLSGGGVQQRLEQPGRLDVEVTVAAGTDQLQTALLGISGCEGMELGGVDGEQPGVGAVDQDLETTLTGLATPVQVDHHGIGCAARIGGLTGVDERDDVCGVDVDDQRAVVALEPLDQDLSAGAGT